MDPLAIFLGSLVGVATGLIPGLHVNTIAAVGFAIAPNAGPTGAVFLIAVGTVHTIVNIIPGTFLGVPDEDGVTMMPAHQLLLQGRGGEAVGVSVSASLLALAAVAALAIPYGRGLHAIAAWLDWSTPAILAGAMMWLVAGAGRRWWRAVLVALAAAGVSVVAFMVPLRPLVAVPATPLLPLLGGLFGGAGLTLAMQRPGHVPTQHVAPHPTRRYPWLVAISWLAAAVTSVMPGLSAGIAASFVPGAFRGPRRAVAVASSINTSHAGLALLVWWNLGRIRTGLADASQRWQPRPHFAQADGAMELIATMLIAGVLGAAATIALQRPATRLAPHIQGPGLAVVAFAMLCLVVVALAGFAGFAVFALAAFVGRLPFHLGVRRIHLVGALVIPAFIRSL